MFYNNITIFRYIWASMLIYLQYMILVEGAHINIFSGGPESPSYGPAKK